MEPHPPDATARALDRATTIRKCYSTVRRQVDQAGEELTEMVTEARESIAEIKDLSAV
jgi:selenocysteine lyase/cysteine desulfurase